MNIGCIVEGQSEERVVPIILGWLGKKHRSPFRARSRQDLVANARVYAQEQLARGATHVLFFFDADQPDGEAAWAVVEQKLTGMPFIGFVPVQEIEAWLMADERALSKVIGTPDVARVRDPQSLVKPSLELDALFTRYGAGHYNKGFHPKRIAEAATDKAWRRLPSYERATQPLR